MKAGRFLVACLWGGMCAVATGAPLLQEGKQTLYERVLTTPGCQLKSAPGATGGKEVPAFTRYYVYGREGGALKVGAGTNDRIDGYIDVSCAVPWRNQLALRFTNPAGRERALIFSDQKDLQALVEAPEPLQKLTPLRGQMAAQGRAEGVVAQEPATFIDYRQQFYLLPILSAEETMFDDGSYTRLLEIASVTLQNREGTPNQGASSQAAAPGDPAEEARRLKSFKAALVFVIDATISMRPYIERTRQAIDAIYRRLEKEQLEPFVQFGVVSYRSSTAAVPGLEYCTRVHLRPGEAGSLNELKARLKDLDEAKVSSASFDEDAYAGIKTALSEIDWSEYGGRYLVLITDAGALRGADKLSSTGLDSSEVRREAEHQGVAVYALHLLTKAGADNHASARAQYEDLTANQVVNKSLYYPVNAGDVGQFGAMVDDLAGSIANDVHKVLSGNDQPPAPARAAAGADAGANAPAQSGAAEDLQQSVSLLGHAMRLAYLGRVTGTKAPAFFSGWIADRDLTQHERAVAEPVVLLTKDELSQLKDLVTHLFEDANTGIVDPDGMFAQLRSLAVSMGRDPARLSESRTLKIAEMGLLNEYLQGLPYLSRIQDLDEETWMSMGPAEQNAVVRDLESKLAYYQQCNDDTDRWVSLAPGTPAGERVFPVPLEMLP